MAHSLSRIIPRVGPHMAHINWFGKGGHRHLSEQAFISFHDSSPCFPVVHLVTKMATSAIKVNQQRNHCFGDWVSEQHTVRGGSNI